MQTGQGPSYVLLGDAVLCRCRDQSKRVLHSCSPHQAGGVGFMAQKAVMASVICSEPPDIYPSHAAVGADTRVLDRRSI